MLCIDVTDQLLLNLKNAGTFFTLDESTDITAIAPLEVVVRFLSGNITTEELIKLLILTEGKI